MKTEVRMKNLLPALVAFCVLALLVGAFCFGAMPAEAVTPTLEGSGTQSDPYLVSTAEELQAAMDSTANDINYITYTPEDSFEPVEISVPVILGEEDRPMVLTLEGDLSFSEGGVLRIENQATIQGGYISSRETDASVYINTEEAVCFMEVDISSYYCESCVVLEHSPNVSFESVTDDGRFDGANTGLVLIDSSATVSGYTFSVEKSIYSLDESSSLTLDGTVKTGPYTHKRPHYVEGGIEFYFANKFGWGAPTAMITKPGSDLYSAFMTALEETDADGNTLWYYTVAPSDIDSSGEVYFYDAQGGGTGGKSQTVSFSGGSVYVPDAVGSKTEPCGLTSYTYVALHEHNGVRFDMAWTATTGAVTSGNYYFTDGVSATGGLTVPAGANVSLCLCGHTLDLGTGSLTVEAGGTLSIYDCSADGAGKITASTATDWSGTILVSGSLFQYGGTVENTTSSSSYSNSAAILTDGDAAEVTVTGGKVIAAFRGIALRSGGTLTVSGDAYVEGTKTASGTGIYLDGSGRASVSGGIVKGGDAGIAAQTSTAEVFVSGNAQILATGSYSGYGIRNHGVLKISGGSVSGQSYGIFVGNSEDAKLYLSGAPVITGTTASIAKVGASGVVAASDGGVAYTGEVLSVHPTQPSDGQVVITGISGNASKFALCNTQGYFLLAGEGTEADSLVLLEHTHTFSSDYAKNGTHHWHPCTAAGCPITDFSTVSESGYTTHTFDSGNVCTSCSLTCYNVWLGGVRLTPLNASGEGYEYDDETQTLSLNNYTFVGEGYLKDYKSALYAAHPLTVEYSGTNVLTENSDSKYSAAIYIYIKGGTNGIPTSLTLKAVGEGASLSLTANAKVVKVPSGLTVTGGEVSMLRKGYTGETLSSDSTAFSGGDFVVENASLLIRAEGGYPVSLKMPSPVGSSEIVLQSANGLTYSSTAKLDSESAVYDAYASEALDGTGSALVSEQVNAINYQYVKLLPHAHKNTVATSSRVTDATCQKQALYKAKCERCGTVSETDTVPSGAFGAHVLTYAQNGTSGILEGCSESGCTHSETVLLLPPEGTPVFDGQTSFKASAAYSEGWEGAKPSISYVYPAHSGNSWDAGNHTASLTVGGVTASVDYVVAQAEPDMTGLWPVGLSHPSGKTLGEIDLTEFDEEAAGVFAFEAPTTVVTEGYAEYSLIFTPTNQNYKAVKKNVQVFGFHTHGSLVFEVDLPEMNISDEIYFDKNTALSDDASYRNALVPAGSHVSLCLCGHTLTLTGADALVIEEGATLSIYDCSEGKTGKIVADTSGSTDSGTIEVRGSLFLYGGTIENTSARTSSSAAIVTKGTAAEVTMTGGRAIGFCGIILYRGGTLTVSGDAYVEGVGQTEIGTGYGLYLDCGGKANLSGGTVKGVGVAIGTSSAASAVPELTISGSAMIIATGSNSDGIFNDGILKLSGGSVVAQSYGIDTGGVYSKLSLSGTPTLNAPTASLHIRGALGEISASFGGAAYAGASLTLKVTSPEDGQIAVSGISGNAGKFSLLDTPNYILVAGEGDDADCLLLEFVHTHAWASAYTSDGAYHWHECTAAGCPISDNAQKDGYAAHMPKDDDGDCMTAILCSACDAVTTAKKTSHAYSYSASGSVITETCERDGCTAHSETATLEASKTAYIYGELPSVSVSYSDGWAGGTLTISYAKGGSEVTDLRDAGSYTASVSISGRSAAIPFTVSEKTAENARVEVMLPQGGFVYTGEAYEPVVKVFDGDIEIPATEYTVTYASNIGVGNAVITVTDKENGNYTVSGTGGFAIAKGTYDMSGVTLTDKAVKADGSAHSILIGGNLPAGVSVQYTNNGKTEVGVYTVTASFTGDAVNYHAIADMSATLTVKQAEISSTIGGASVPTVVVTSTGGFAPTLEIVVVEIPVSEADAGNVLRQNEVIGASFDITMKQAGASVQPDGTIEIRLLIPASVAGKNFRILHNHESSVSEVSHTVLGDYAVFSVDRLSEFLFVYEEQTPPVTTVPAVTTQAPATTEAPTTTTQAPATTEAPTTGAPATTPVTTDAPSSGEGGFRWWILLIVVFAVLLVGAALYWFLLKK